MQFIIAAAIIIVAILAGSYYLSISTQPPDQQSHTSPAIPNIQTSPTTTLTNPSDSLLPSTPSYSPTNLSPSPTSTYTLEPTYTFIPPSPTSTHTSTNTPQYTPTTSPSPSSTINPIPTSTSTLSPEPTPTNTLSPSAMPTATLTPISSPTQDPTTVPTPTPTIISTSLSDALALGYIQATISGTGSSTGDCINLHIRRLVDFTVEIDVPVIGSMLTTSDDAQNMVIYKLQGISQGLTYIPTSTIKLTSSNEVTYLFSAYCLDSRKPNPQTSTTFTITGQATSDVIKILSILDSLSSNVATIEAVQTAIWVVTDDIPLKELTSIFPAGARQIENAKTILTAASIDISQKQLFK